MTRYVAVLRPARWGWIGQVQIDPERQSSATAGHADLLWIRRELVAPPTFWRPTHGWVLRRTLRTVRRWNATSARRSATVVHR